MIITCQYHNRCRYVIRFPTSSSVIKRTHQYTPCKYTPTILINFIIKSMIMWREFNYFSSCYCLDNALLYMYSYMYMYLSVYLCNFPKFLENLSTMSFVFFFSYLPPPLPLSQFTRSSTAPTYTNIGGGAAAGLPGQYGAPSPPPSRNNLFINSAVPSSLAAAAASQGMPALKHVSRPNTLASAISR